MFCPSDESISFRLSLIIPAMMLPPLSVAKFMLIYIASFGLYYRMDTSLFTEKIFVAVDVISGVMDLPA